MLLSLIVLSVAGNITAQEQSEPLMPQRTAAVTDVVLGILGYTRWKSEPGPIDFCVTAPTEYADTLLHANLEVLGQPLIPQRIEWDAEDIALRCQVIYIGVMEETDYMSLSHRISGSPILTISEQDERCSVGSMFCLLVNNLEVRFLVNLDSIARSGVRVHPHVLKLGNRTVVQE
ncbi:YfiR family protein [Nitrincola sp. MINF-07-Sa-05]|uniref:YfiR family protein n=1 Tax=Nitrincola salilacus TaxID=3400273 RepID=UPI0039184F31